ncbi:E3 ubiquitin-protein ligase AIRP2 [Bienertia sinuspersici]
MKSVILHYLQRLHANISELRNCANSSSSSDLAIRKIGRESRQLSDIDFDREDGCGICLEPYTKVNLRLESCPFCRGTIKRVQSGDLWVLTCGTDVVDPKTVFEGECIALVSLHKQSTERCSRRPLHNGF